MSWLAIPLGLTTGAVMGALGGGGAILTIPVLIYVLGLQPHTATTASLVIVGLSAVAAVAGQARHGTVRAGDAALLAAAGSLGTYAGSRASAAVAPTVLVVLLASLLAVVGALMVRRTGAAEHSGAGDGVAQEAGARAAADATGGPAAADPAAADPAQPQRAGETGRRLGRLAAVGVGIGLLTGFFGVGGGFAIVPALTLVLGYAVQPAVGTSLLVIALNSATAFAARVGQGVQLDWGLVGLFTVGSVVGSLVGGALGRRAAPDTLSRAFAVLLFLVAAYMLVAAVLAR